MLARHILLDRLDLVDEGLPELVERHGPLFFTARDGIELVFHRRREAVLHITVEMFRQEAAHDLADVGGNEAAGIHLDIFPILQGRDDGGVGGGPADPMLFEGFHERSFGVAWRRLGEVLLGVHRQQIDGVTLGHRWQHVIAVVRFRVVDTFLVYRNIARLHEGGAIRAKHVPVGPIGAGEHVDCNRVENRVIHL